ncbi:amino acid/amide ABC transporter substrate-binding protein, HAAT family [Marinobacter daqiaonensis]|uniref:Amino acid/amide ABC transporter substrate-binding protein, HAAT family n=1 Tax=Marinobacter daqiaonensis TaxID=650891 RepID=A0A1I6ILU6_9GAMM|nr:ABC transporter substrate-binding protein [Marinobacter daqiaonensis]SFR67698.1 amino acid/amide ABC transporter substrate-binding protein, HAAT family [Marinobacter daqiaonensis]
MKTAKKLGLAVAVATLGMGMSAASMAEEVNIGFSGPLSGGAALYGENVLSGLRMAAEEINANGGFDINGEMHTVNVVALDDQYSPAQAATNAKRLIQESEAPAIFIPHSGGIFALMDFNVEDDFLIMAYTSVPTITAQGNPLTLRIPPTFDGYVKAFTDYAIEEYGTKLAMGGATHEYAKIWGSMIEKAWEAKGGEVVAKNPMDYNKSADFFTGVSKLLAEDPDVMFVGGASEPTGLVIQQARQLGYEGAFIMMDQAKIDEAAVAAGGLEPLENTVGVVPLSTDESEAAQSFIKRYEEKYGKTPGSEAAYNYLAMHALVEAMDMTDSTDPKTIRAAMNDAIAQMDSSKNPYAVEEIDEAGGFVTMPTMSVVKDGKIMEVTF